MSSHAPVAGPPGPRGTSASTAPVLGTPGLWFIALGGASAYALHLVAGFWLVALVCRSGSPLWLHGLGAVTLTVAGTAAVHAVLVLRALRRTPARAQGEGMAAGEHGRGPLVTSVVGAMLLRRVRLAAALLVAAALRRRGQGGARPAQPVHTVDAAGPLPMGPPRRVGLLSAKVLAGDRARVQFMAGVGLAMNIVSVLLIVTHWVPVAFFDPCV